MPHEQINLITAADKLMNAASAVSLLGATLLVAAPVWAQTWALGDRQLVGYADIGGFGTGPDVTRHAVGGANHA